MCSMRVNYFGPVNCSKQLCTVCRLPHVTIANGASVKTLYIIDGKLEISEDLINGSLTRN